MYVIIREKGVERRAMLDHERKRVWGRQEVVF
jgi:hypothetical protein